MKTWILTALAAATLALGAACAKETPPAQKAQPVVVQPGTPLEITVTSDGYTPALLKARVGQPVKLVVTRKVERSCATEFVIKELNINKPLPVNQAVEIEFTPPQPGKLQFSCAMDMIGGTIIVE